MSVEVVLILAGLWVLLGLIDAWVLHQLGRSGWRLLALCGLAGPFSLSIVYDEARPAEREAAAPTASKLAGQPEPDASIEFLVDKAGGTAEVPGEPIDWPVDDPESPFILQGYRGLSDH